MEDRETARMRKYGKSKTTRIMMATVPHVTSGLGLRKFQADWFLLTQVYQLSSLLWCCCFTFLISSISDTNCIHFVWWHDCTFHHMYFTVNKCLQLLNVDNTCNWRCLALVWMFAILHIQGCMYVCTYKAHAPIFILVKVEKIEVCVQILFSLHWTDLGSWSACKMNNSVW